MNKFVIILIAVSLLAIFLYYTTKHEKETILLDEIYQNCKEADFSIFSKEYPIETLDTLSEEGRIFFSKETLYWSNLTITSIPDSFFYYHPCVVSLNLDYNYFQEIPKSIQFLKDLNDLNLSDNQIKTLPSKKSFYRKLTKLKRANFRYNQLSEFPVGFIHSPSLVDLHLDENQIQTIPTAFLNKNASLANIFLNHNKIKEFPNSFHQLPLLNSLELEDNEIVGTVALKAFKKLGYLNLNNNQITTFSSDIASSKYLRSLSIGDNNLQSFITTNSSYDNLISLFLSQNQLSSFTLSNQIYPKIEYFSIRENELEELYLPSLLPFLKKMDISHNRLKTLSNLINTPKLVELDISNNKLTELPTSLLEMKNLENFSCAINNISNTIEWKHQKVERLILSHNKIEEVIIEDSPNLTKIKLNGNHLKSFSIDKESLTSLKILDLSDNPELIGFQFEYIIRDAPNLESFQIGEINLSGRELDKFKQLVNDLEL